MNIQDERKETAKILGGKCYVCHKRWAKGFTFHHLFYRKRDRKYSDFPNSEAYNEYVLNVVRTEPDRFAILCIKHHRLVEILKSMKDEKLENLINVVLDSRGGMV